MAHDHKFPPPPPKKRKIPTGVRLNGTSTTAVRARALVERDGDQCHYCSIPLSDGMRTIDHVLPKSKGGTSHLDNLVLACFACNNKKGNRSYEEFVGHPRIRRFYHTPTIIEDSAMSIEPTVHPVTMDHVKASPVRGTEDSFTLGGGHRTLPFDLPVYMRVNRHMGDVNGARGLLGTSLEIDCFTFQANVTLKFVNGRAMVVLVDGQEVARIPTPSTNKESDGSAGEVVPNE